MGGGNIDPDIHCYILLIIGEVNKMLVTAWYAAAVLHFILYLSCLLSEDSAQANGYLILSAIAYLIGRVEEISKEIRK